MKKILNKLHLRRTPQITEEAPQSPNLLSDTYVKTSFVDSYKSALGKLSKILTFCVWLVYGAVLFLNISVNKDLNTLMGRAQILEETLTDKVRIYNASRIITTKINIYNTASDERIDYAKNTGEFLPLIISNFDFDTLSSSALGTKPKTYDIQFSSDDPKKVASLISKLSESEMVDYISLNSATLTSASGEFDIGIEVVYK